MIPDMTFKWNCKKLVLKSLRNTFSANLLKSIENRESQIFSKPIIIASMFLDKRFSTLLSNDYIGTAKTVINQIQNRFKSLEMQTSETFAPVSETINDQLMDLMMDEESEMVENIKVQLTQEPFETTAIDGSTANALAVELSQYQDMKRFRARLL